MNRETARPDGLSLTRGIPLSEERGIGALTLGGYIRELAGRYGPREAAVCYLEQAPLRWTYAELWERSVEVARALAAGGLGKGTRVGILMTNRLEFLSSVFGTALAGGVATPISTFFTATELDEVLRVSGCSVLLAERSVLKKDFGPMLIDLEPEIESAAPGSLRSKRFPFLRRVVMLDRDTGHGAIEAWPDFLARGREIPTEQIDAAADSVAPGDPATLFFSSGSTGKAKGILHAQRSVCLQLWRSATWYSFDEPPRTWSSNGFFFSGNFCQALGGALTSGGTLVLQRWFDAGAALALMENERATMPLAWPHQWAQLEAAPNYAEVDLSALSYLDARSPLAQHPTISTTWREPREAYGCTETFTIISVYPSGTPGDIAAASHGLPTAGAVIKIVDPLIGNVLPVGCRGEIAVKGPTLMLGYAGIPLDDTLDSEGFFRTNDGGYVDERGRLHWEGRLNDIIKTGGANVSPLEIDAVIRRLPGVKISQTVGVPDDLLGERVVTCIVPHEGHALSQEQVREFARKSLASYKVPRQVLLFAEDEVAVTGSAKIKTAELRQLAVEQLNTGN